MKTKTLLPLLALLLLATTLPAPPAPAAEAPSPWDTLTTLRSALTEAGTLRAEFTQTYVPAGFSSGERERGAMTLALPECMRWDYDEPYQKSFLLCGDQAHYWNAEDNSGRRYTVDRDEEPGLDLLMLSVDTLRQRYDASAEALDDGRVRVTLQPLTDAGSLAEASLTVAPDGDGLSAVTYRDREGNLTRFALAEPTAQTRDQASADGVFEPPTGIRWQN